MIRRRLIGLLLCTAVASGTFAMPAAAAESYDNCKGYIESLPSTITTPGVWCLRGNLTTMMTDGAAIRLGANNVTLDCNGFGITSQHGLDTVVGVRADAVVNVTVRHCRLAAFGTGILLAGDNAVVEDNALHQAMVAGIRTIGDGNVVRRNRVLDTGALLYGVDTWGIDATGQGTRVIDNDVQGVSGSGTAVGLRIQNGVAANNRISDIRPMDGAAVGIRLSGTVAIDNLILQTAIGAAGTGVAGDAGATSLCRSNVIAGFTTAISDCTAVGNTTHP